MTIRCMQASFINIYFVIKVAYANVNKTCRFFKSMFTALIGNTVLLRSNAMDRMGVKRMKKQAQHTRSTSLSVFLVKCETIL